jgi:FAD/FMN-containing dehydrogenase/Fe-S oxidoreductase
VDIDSKQLADDLRGKFRGRLALDSLTRGLYSTDASPFQVTPVGVAFPEDAEDLSALVRYCYDHALPLTARGAGTGVAGESLGPGLVVDLSVNFRRILDTTADTVTVEPGVLLAELNAALAPDGRRFAPDPARGATCTVGGIVACDASGGNAFRHGYVRDHVLGLDVVWDNGLTGRVGQDLTPRPPSLEKKGVGGSDPDATRTLELLRATADLLTANRDLIARSGPQTRFDRCGYRLGGVLTEHGPNLARLLVGSEGTLCLITRATLRTVPLPGGTCVALLGFGTLDAAIQAGLSLRALSPVGCDLLDRRLLSLTRHAGPAQAVGLIPPSVGAALLVIFEADTEREARERTWGGIEKLRESHRLGVLAEPSCDPAGTARVRGVREAAVAGMYAMGKGPRPVAFIEDVGVPAEALPEFLTRTQDVLQRFELTASFLVHALTGQVHTRPLIDLDNPADREKLWPVAEAVHGLALTLGGTVSTQHGTGIARTPWVERQAGPLMPVFRELKRIFDPKNVLNPGKIVGPDPSRPAWPLRTGVRTQETGISPDTPEGTPPGEPVASLTPESRLLTPLLVWHDSSPEAEAAKCTGCGDCRPRGTRTRMCPVFQATGLEAATPRAKANLVRALASPAEMASDEVREIAELCVNCKMCRDECPARVDVPKMMLEAKAVHQAEHGLDRDDWILARTESFAAIGSHFAPLVNGLLGRLSVRWLLEKVFGVSRNRRLPAFALRNFFRHARGAGLTKKCGIRNAERGLENTGSAFRIPSSAFRIQKVAYFVDVFAAYNDPLIGEATVAVLRHNGVEVYVPPRQVGCGMAPLAVGDAETAREAAVRNVRVFADLVREGYRIVCSEPTAALMLSQDYLDLLDDPDAAALAANTAELTTFLWDLHHAGRLNTRFRPVNLTVGHHVPCHLKALRGPVAGPGLLSLIPGLRVRTIDVSCSGMAGTWGLKAKNHAASLAAGGPMLAELNRPGVLFGSTECSTCRMQMQEGTGKRALHPVQYLAYAYGLLPEIGAKLRKPLGERVSD